MQCSLKNKEQNRKSSTKMNYFSGDEILTIFNYVTRNADCNGLRRKEETGIPFTVRGKIPRFSKKTKGANFLRSIWLLDLDVMACRHLDELFYSGTNVSSALI